ncbi:hypothetical protein B0H16DRAFT_1326569 [Mycena metata]|uniref:WD-like domain-containing protein n=1 Tax=Mycena metata TaxID=1033252 RepID=A0AAD7I8U8_9AGAR|nr:hypothetical protein B0H16DRAFT_1326569 [Mycena metata]
MRVPATPPQIICQELVNNLAANPRNNVGDLPRAVCLGQSRNECCVSWSAGVGNIPQGDLSSAASQVLGGCTEGLVVSGLARNVQLGGKCVTECLSNRVDGCS